METLIHTTYQLTKFFEQNNLDNFEYDWEQLAMLMEDDDIDITFIKNKNKWIIELEYTGMNANPWNYARYDLQFCHKTNKFIYDNNSKNNPYFLNN